MRLRTELPEPGQVLLHMVQQDSETISRICKKNIFKDFKLKEKLISFHQNLETCLFKQIRLKKYLP